MLRLRTSLVTVATSRACGALYCAWYIMPAPATWAVWWMDVPRKSPASAGSLANRKWPAQAHGAAQEPHRREAHGDRDEDERQRQQRTRSGADQAQADPHEHDADAEHVGRAEAQPGDERCRQRHRVGHDHPDDD